MQTVPRYASFNGLRVRIIRIEAPLNGQIDVLVEFPDGANWGGVNTRSWVPMSSLVFEEGGDAQG